MKLQDEKSAKREYKSPELLIYGNIAELTQNDTQTMNSDNPTMKS